MAFLSKLTGKTITETPQQAKKLTNRFIGKGDWQKAGATYHAPRTNTSEEILRSLKLLAKEEADKATKGRKLLPEKITELGYNFNIQAKESGQDIIDIVIQKQNAYAEALNAKLSRGIQLTDAERTEYKKLSSLSNIASAIKSSELKSKEIIGFLNVADDIPQRHLSLAHDIVDLSNTHTQMSSEIFPTVDFNATETIAGKQTTLMGYVLNKLQRLSKENPEAVNLAETVVSHSDHRNGKFFLSKFVDYFPFHGTEKQAEATEPLVKSISESVLSGMPSMTLGPSSKEQTFFDIIQGLCSPTSKPENLKILKQVMDSTGNLAPNVATDINLDVIRLGDTAKMTENMKVLPQVLKNAETQGLNYLDVSGFLTKNVNLK